MVLKYDSNEEKWKSMSDEVEENGSQCPKIRIEVNQHLFNLSKKLSVQLVATNDVHYIKKEHAEAHDILTCLQRGMLVADPSRYRY